MGSEWGGGPASLRSCGEADADEDQSDAGHDPSDAGSEQSAAPDTASVIDASSVQSFHPVTVPAVDTSDTAPMVAAGHVPTVIPDAMGNAPFCPIGEWGRVGQAPPMQEDGVVRTRVGRVVGKVNRLIETMAQKPCDMTTSFG